MIRITCKQAIRQSAELNCADICVSQIFLSRGTVFSLSWRIIHGRILPTSTEIPGEKGLRITHCGKCVVQLMKLPHAPKYESPRLLQECAPFCSSWELRQKTTLPVGEGGSVARYEKPDNKTTRIIGWPHCLDFYFSLRWLYTNTLLFYCQEQK